MSIGKTHLSMFKVKEQGARSKSKGMKGDGKVMAKG
jgi:hypothetical protein